MLLNSFAFEQPEVTVKMMGTIWQEIERNESYIYYNVPNNDTKANVMLAKQMIFLHAIHHFDAQEEKLQRYIRKLAKTIYKTTTNGLEIAVDFSDGNMVYAVGTTEGTKPNEVNLVTKTPDKVTPDFSADIIDALYRKEELQQNLYSMVLDNLVEYVTLCKTLLSGDIDNLNFSVSFTKQCLALSHQYKEDFNTACLDLYNTYKEYFDRFASESQDKNIDNIETLWYEADYNLIVKKKSKRIIFYNKKTNKPVEDVEKEKFYIIGAKNISDGKKILKVDFKDAWQHMCDLVDASQTNEMKLILGDNFLIKTLGGSLSVVNPASYNMYELLRTEILTNILYETSGRLLAEGEGTVYILWDNAWTTVFQQNMDKMAVGKRKWVEHKNLYGVEFDINYEDVTNKLTND